MMKKFTPATVRTLCLCGVALFTAAAFTACSDDDDNGGGGGGAGAALPKSDAMKYREVGGDRFSYDEQGRCTHYGYITVDYDEKTISDGDDVCHITFNSNGYITKLTENSDSRDDEDYERGDDYDVEKSEQTVSYNSNGNITKVSVKGSVEGYEDGERYKESGTTTVNYTWKDGNVVKVKYSENYDGERYEEEYTFTYGDQDNVTKRYTYAYERTEAFGDGYEMMGLLGKGPAKLPTKIVNEYHDSEDDDSGTDTWNISYRLDELGRVYSENIDGNTYYYYYLSGSEGDEARVRAFAIENEPAARTPRHGFLAKRHHRK